MANTCEALVIGCGILGVSAAYSLLKCNVSTTILEQYSTHFHQYGGSFGQSRIWRVTYPNPIYAKMMLQSLKIWKEIETTTSTKLLSYCGGLDFAHKNSKPMQNIIDTLSKNNFKFEILSAQQTMKRFKPIKLPTSYYSVYIPNKHGIIYADKALNAMVQCVKKLNGTIKYNTKVIKVEINVNNKYKYTVYTNSNLIYKTNNIIFACGAYKLPPLINKTQKDCNFDYPVIKRINDTIKPIELNVAYIKPLDDNVDISNYPAWEEYDANDVCKWYGLIATQYTPFGKVYCMKTGYTPMEMDEQDMNAENSLERIIKYVKKRWHGEWEIFAFKKCYISENQSQNEDHLTIDRIVENENLFIMHGHSHGFKHGPQMGNIVKDLVLYKNMPHCALRLCLCKVSKL